MRQRTEDEILSMAPITAKFGAREYSIKPLTILKQREWRKQLSAELGVIVSNFSMDADKRTVVRGLTESLTDFPEKVAELIFSYAPDLPKEEILATATEEQLNTAFSAIMQVAFPFLALLGTVTQVVKATPQTPASYSN